MASIEYKGVIYIYTNKINGKVYIGQTINEERRRYEHKNCKEDFYFHKAVKKYGWDNFEYNVLVRIITEDKEYLLSKLDKIETYFISFYDSCNRDKGYNLTPGGHSSSKSRFKPVQMISLDTSDVIEEFESIQDAYRYLKIDARGDISKCCKGERGSAHGFFWQYFDEEERSKYKKFQKINNKKEVEQLDLNSDDIINTFNSVAEANRYLDKDVSNRQISKCCNGHEQSAFGYRWRFKNSGDINTENIGVKITSKNVIQFNPDTGKIINSFNSINDASISTGVNCRNISNCANNTESDLTAGGFCWAFNKKDVRVINKEYERPGNSVIQIDKNTGEILNEFISIESAARAVGLAAGTPISKCCTGGRNTAAGYKWKYKN